MRHSSGNSPSLALPILLASPVLAAASCDAVDGSSLSSYQVACIDSRLALLPPIVVDPETPFVVVLSSILGQPGSTMIFDEPFDAGSPRLGVWIA